MHLTPSQLNWKPSPERWSVAQCFDHLLTSNKGYFPIIDNVLAGHKRTFWQSMPVLPGLMGKLLIKSSGSGVNSKDQSAQSVFNPRRVISVARVINDFIDQQRRSLQR